jgi:hypothetical protein
MIKTLILIFALLVAPFAYADQPIELSSDMLKKGETKTTLMGISLYQGTLYTQQGQPFNIDGKFALTLDYLRGFKATTLAKATIKEIERIEGTMPDDSEVLFGKLTSCFANVSAGDRITGVARSTDEISFYFNGRKRCDLMSKNIRKQFFGIWLGDDTRDAKGTARLKGLS